MNTVIRVLSGGSIEAGLVRSADGFQKKQGTRVDITWATTPAMRKLVPEGHVADVIIAPPHAIDEFVQLGKADGARRIYVGRVGVGVAIRDGAPTPDVSTVESLKAALLAADSVVFNRASSGLYVEQLMQRWGMFERIGEKIMRFDNGPGMLEHVMQGRGREICIGALNEFQLFHGKGLATVGPLPEEVQNYTRYLAVAASGAPSPVGAQAFLDYLSSDESKAVFAEEGIA